MAIEIVQYNNPKEVPLYSKDNPLALYETAKDEGKTLSAKLEELNPSLPGDKLDAFERQLQRCGIIMRHDLEKGIYAGTGALFFQSNMPESRILFPEYISRQIRAAMIERGDFLDYIVATWEFGQNSAFRSVYLDDTAANRKAGKVAEGGYVRKFKASWSEKHVHMQDFGIELDASYDFIKQVSLPMFDLILQRLAMQRALDELGEAIYVILNGDGSGKESTGAYVDKLSDMGVAGPTGVESMTFKSYLKWQSQFYPYKMTAVMGSISDLVDFYTMTAPTDTTYALMSTLLETSAAGGRPVFAQSPFGPVTLIPFSDTDVVTADDLVGVDKNFGIVGHRDVGVDLVETDRLITSKFERIVISNKVGFSNFFRSATRKLDGDA